MTMMTMTKTMKRRNEGSPSKPRYFPSKTAERGKRSYCKWQAWSTTEDCETRNRRAGGRASARSPSLPPPCIPRRRAGASPQPQWPSHPQSLLVLLLSLVLGSCSSLHTLQVERTKVVPKSLPSLLCGLHPNYYYN